MHFFKKLPVAILLSLIIIALSIALGLAKHIEAYNYAPVHDENGSSTALVEAPSSIRGYESIVSFFSELQSLEIRSPRVDLDYSNLFQVISFVLFLVIVFTIVDNVRYSRYVMRYGNLPTPPTLFRPILFWHGPGSRWFLHREQRRWHRTPPPPPPSGFGGFNSDFSGNGFEDFSPGGSGFGGFRGSSKKNGFKGSRGDRFRGRH